MCAKHQSTIPATTLEPGKAARIRTGRVPSLPFRSHLDFFLSGACVSAEAAAVLAALDDLGSIRTFDAAVAAFLLAHLIFLISCNHVQSVA
jgi:hypothetical protein